MADADKEDAAAIAAWIISTTEANPDSKVAKMARAYTLLLSEHDRQREEIGRKKAALINARVFILNYADRQHQAKALSVILEIEAALSDTTRGK